MEFVLVSTPILLLTMSVLGISVNGYAKNIAQDIAIDTSRYAALADQDAETAKSRAQKTLELGIGSEFQPRVDVVKRVTSAGCSFQVEVDMAAIPLGFVSRASLIKETAYASCELE
ncbi:MAG: hypothetical protein RJA66_85 [Actinomycetota bacterium]